MPVSLNGRSVAPVSYSPKTETSFTPIKYISSLNGYDIRDKGARSGLESVQTDVSQLKTDVAGLKSGKANTTATVDYTITVGGWSGMAYSFDGDYPAETYDIEVVPSDAMTADQFEAFTAAQMVGSFDMNTVTAYGVVPTIDLPVKVRSVMR